MRKRHHEADEANIDMTPMLDIVFIMLIFFIVTTSFIKESGIALDRPSKTPPQETKEKSLPVLVKINDQNEITIKERVVDVRAVQANVERAKAENPNTVVIVQADQDSDTETLISVVDAAKSAGVTKVSVATAAKK